MWDEAVAFCPFPKSGREDSIQSVGVNRVLHWNEGGRQAKSECDALKF